MALDCLLRSTEDVHPWIDRMTRRYDAGCGRRLLQSISDIGQNCLDSLRTSHSKYHHRDEDQRAILHRGWCEGCESAGISTLYA